MTSELRMLLNLMAGRWRAPTTRVTAATSCGNSLPCARKARVSSVLNHHEAGTGPSGALLERIQAKRCKTSIAIYMQCLWGHR